MTDAVAEAVVEALLAAATVAVPARLRLTRVTVPAAAPVAFQRSLRAHRANPGRRRARPEDAVERSVPVLRVEDLTGRALGLLAVVTSHGTTLHSDVPVLHPDHPGLAASLLERGQTLACEGFVALVAQGAAGDSSPNYRWSKARGLAVGRTEDDLVNVSEVAEAFAGVIAQGLDRAATAPALEGAVGGRLRHVDFADAEVDAAFTGGMAQRTVGPVLGLGFPIGTAEGPGPFGALGGLLHAGARVRRRWLRVRYGDGPVRPEHKIPFGPLGQGLEGHFLGLVQASALAQRVRGLDPVLDGLGACYREGLPMQRCWVPTVLPVQVLQLGGLRLLGVAGEPTLAAGALLRAAALRFSEPGADALVLGYANAYAGYITTPEEYDVQAYEGGHTLFGRLTLPAWLTAARAVLQQEESVVVPGPRPVLVPRDVLVREREVMRWALSRRHRYLVAGQDGTVLRG